MEYSAIVTIKIVAANDEEAKTKAKEIEKLIEERYNFFLYLWSITQWEGVKPREIYKWIENG